MPQFLIAGKLVPALLAGCPIIVKPAPETPLDALLLAELVEELGLPPGVVSVLPGGRELGEYLVGHPGVDKVSFTGSTAAGRQVAAMLRVSSSSGSASSSAASRRRSCSMTPTWRRWPPGSRIGRR